MKKYRLMYRYYLDKCKEIHKTELEYFRTYHYAFKKFNKLKEDDYTISVYLEKRDKKKYYSITMNAYRKYEKRGVAI